MQFPLIVCKYFFFNKLISSKLLCFCYMMFLDAWVIFLSIYKYFILFFIFLILLVYSLRFLRKKFKFVVKLFIYLFIYLSHVRLDDRLDYDNINTILLIFPKKKRKKLLFPLWNCTLDFFFFFLKEKELQSFNFPILYFLLFLIVLLLSFINFFRYISQCFWFYG